MMSEERRVALEFLAERRHRTLSGLRIFRDDVDVPAAAMRRLDNSYDRLETGLSRFLAEFREIRSELRAMHAEHDRTAARLRVLEERPT